jgi:hypothetical protein
MQIAPKRQHRFGEVRFERYDVAHELSGREIEGRTELMHRIAGRFRN